MTTSKWNVGDIAIVRDVNDRGGKEPQRFLVTRVGRTLVYIAVPWGEESYRIDTGRRNDRYGHSWIVTEQEEADAQRLSAALARLRDFGLEPVRYNRTDLPTGLLERVIALIESETTLNGEGALQQ